MHQIKHHEGYINTSKYYNQAQDSTPDPPATTAKQHNHTKTTKIFNRTIKNTNTKKNIQKNLKNE
ncbi:hypothetical protein Q6284_34165, partial [Klebsiella pneumoniae]|uniref:hypothetical protein n=1 Tax=Klebsiella pneumoniae TaxID=573 RepID=UPI002731863B